MIRDGSVRGRPPGPTPTRRERRGEVTLRCESRRHTPSQSGGWNFAICPTVAQKTILHDADHRSRIVLGVLPAGRAHAMLPSCDSCSTSRAATAPTRHRPGGYGRLSDRAPRGDPSITAGPGPRNGYEVASAPNGASIRWAHALCRHPFYMRPATRVGSSLNSRCGQRL